jgi:AcrR family transcriptional regulator
LRYKSGHKEEVHQKMLSAADRSFRAKGFNGVGVDALAKEAGVTSGAFYKHFSSKSQAFSEALSSGLTEVLEAVNGLQATHGEQWWKAFADFYMEEKRTCEADQSCAMQSLSGEVMRQNDNIKAIFETEMLKIAKLSSGSNNMEDTATAWPKLAMLIGGVTLARSFNNEELSKLVAESIKAEF